MEGKKNIIIIVLLLFVMNNLTASYKEQIYKAYISNNMQVWKQTIDKMEATNNKTNDFLLEIINYQYGYIAWCLGQKNEKEADAYLKKAEQHLSSLEQKGLYTSMVNSYKSAFYGYKIGLNPLKAPFLGFKSIEYAKSAIELGPSNPFGYVQQGNIQYYMPKMFGGSKKEALVYYLKAKTLMEKDNSWVKNNWNYLSLLTIIAQTYGELNDNITSKKYYETILELEPNFLWVKNELYPQLLKKIKS